MEQKDCLFCKIIKGELPSHKVWEDKDYLAFLTIFPNTKGATVVTTKKHYPSYAFDLEDPVLKKMILATKKVAKLLDSAFEDVARTAMVFEGYGVDHVHAKLYPLHGTKTNAADGEWKAIHSNTKAYFNTYPGYVSSNDSERADDKELAELAKRIRELNK